MLAYVVVIVAAALMFASAPAFAGSKEGGSHMSEMPVTKHVDAATPKTTSNSGLLKHANTGTHIKKVIIH
jgi:type VI protein secretion system component Hcp